MNQTQTENLLERRTITLKELRVVDSISDESEKIAAEFRGALRELKEFIAGKKQLNTLDSLIDEL